MFHSAALKLTTWYLLIIMVLSVGSSVALYHVSSSDLTRNARRQVIFFADQLEPEDFRDYTRLRQRQLNDDIANLRQNLLLFNIAVLIAGGAAAYALARRHLQPIEEALESQTRFAADASHELRTPLAAMQTEIEVALRNRGLTKAQAIGQLQSNLEEVGKLKTLSEGLLRLAQRSSEDITDSVAELKPVVKEAVARLKKAAAAKKISIDDRTNNMLIKGDPDSLNELVAILLDNAIKYSPAGSIVKVTSRKHGKLVLLSISDEGAGIPKVELPRIFERFYRADSSRSKQQAQGYGLGLAIAKKIAELHDGEIEVKSRSGKGSTFTLKLALVS